MQIYRGKDFVINDAICVRQPTLGEICDWGEQRYFNMVYNIVATPTDLKYQLSLCDPPVDWNKVTDYEVFLWRYKTLTKDYTEIILGGLDISSFVECYDMNSKQRVLYNREDDVKIDFSIYTLLTDYLRKSHKIKKNEERAMTETTRVVLLEEAREQYEASLDKPYQSGLLPLVSTMVNMEGFKYSWSDVWDMKINAFLDSVHTVMHIKNADHLITSGYSGFGVDLTKISKKNLDYFARPAEM